MRRQGLSKVVANYRRLFPGTTFDNRPHLSIVGGLQTISVLSRCPNGLNGPFFAWTRSAPLSFEDCKNARGLVQHALGAFNTRCVSSTHFGCLQHTMCTHPSCVQPTQPASNQHNLRPTCQAAPNTQPAAHGQPQKWSRWHANPQDGYAISTYPEPT